MAILSTNAAADAAHCTYHVDSERGDDHNDGRTPDTAWRSLERVNEADLHPGDAVLFKRGGAWRGQLRPVSGDETAPITYASYGEGPKPLLLGSRPRNRIDDWVRVKENVWATLPLKYTDAGEPTDLRGGQWRRHQEAGANAVLTHEEADAVTTARVACESGGRMSNHLQLWGPRVATERGTHLRLRFRARADSPFRLPEMTILRGSSPWTRYATATACCDISTEWRDFEVVFQVAESAADGDLHINLGGCLPDGAVLELQLGDLRCVTPNIADPLDVDVGNIIFDHGEVCGWKKWSVDTPENAYDYYYDGASQRVYLVAEDNPATLHESIEMALRRHVIDQSGAHDVSYDGLAVRYGAAHGFGGGSTRRLVIRNCDLCYIGGGHQHTDPSGRPVRFGNAIEFWGAAADHLVEGCRIWEVYDAALTNQNKSTIVRQENIVYRNNVIWNCEYSFEYWNRPEASVTRDVRFINNTCVNAGVVWSHAQRPNPNGSHLMLYSNDAATTGFEVKHNIFYQVSDWGSRYTGGWKTLPDMDQNLWYSDQGVMAYWFAEKIEGFADYRETTGLDAHSMFADPNFVDPSNGDFRVAPDSPARGLRPDGGPVGAEQLWK